MKMRSRKSRFRQIAHRKLNALIRRLLSARFPPSPATPPRTVLSDNRMILCESPTQTPTQTQLLPAAPEVSVESPVKTSINLNHENPLGIHPPTQEAQEPLRAPAPAHPDPALVVLIPARQYSDKEQAPRGGKRELSPNNKARQHSTVLLQALLFEPSSHRASLNETCTSQFNIYLDTQQQPHCPSHAHLTSFQRRIAAMDHRPAHFANQRVPAGQVLIPAHIINLEQPQQTCTPPRLRRKPVQLGIGFVHWSG